VPPAASRLPVTPGERAYQWQDRAVDPSVAAWRQTRQQFRDHRLPFYKLPPNLEYTDPVTKGPGRDHAEAIEWFTVPYHEWERRVWVMRQRNQYASLYIYALDSAVTQILKTQENAVTRDLLLEEAADVRMFDHDDRVRAFCLKQLENIDAAIIAEYKRQVDEHFKNGRYEDARKVCRTLIAEYPSGDGARYAKTRLVEIAEIYILQHKRRGDAEGNDFRKGWDKAIPHYQKLIEEAEACFTECAEVLLAEKPSTTAQSSLITLQNHIAYACMKQGWCLRNVGKEAEAISVFQRGMTEYPQSAYAAESQYRLALTMGGNRVGEEKSKAQRLAAIPQFQKVVEAYGNSQWADDAMYMIGLMYFAADSKEKAKQIWSALADQYASSRIAKAASRNMELLQRGVRNLQGISHEKITVSGNPTQIGRSKNQEEQHK